MRICLGFLAGILLAQNAFAGTWLVGPTHTYTKPSQVSGLVQNGDTVLIDAGVYPNDVARWTANNLLLRGVGGLAHLKSGGNVYGGKAIWVIVGNDVTVESIEFSEAACPDLNGAGIRSEGINLTIRHCFFLHNEDGILAGDISSGDILIEYSEFTGNGHSNGLAHNLYINHAHSLTFRYNYSHDALVGHELKSRAYNNYIYCNRFSDENGNSSRCLDLPNGGFTIVMGNVIVQDQFSENNNIVGYGMEGLSNPNSELYMAYNTFVNNKQVGSFLQFPNGAPLVKLYDNIFAGAGTVISGTALTLDTLGNKVAPIAAFHFTNPMSYDFNIDASSVAVGGAVNAGMAGAYSLTPSQEYQHPSAFVSRADANDVGAYAFASASGLATLDPSPFVVYPNPTSGFLEVQGDEIPSVLTLRSLDGRILGQSHDRKHVDLSTLPAGVYWLNIQWNGNQMTTPVMKQ